MHRLRGYDFLEDAFDFTDVHRDIDDLVTMWQAKLADFGWCAELSESQERLTFCRLAFLPEVKHGNCLKMVYVVVIHQNYMFWVLRT